MKRIMTTQDKKKRQFIPDSELINVSGGKKVHQRLTQKVLIHQASIIAKKGEKVAGARRPQLFLMDNG